MVTTKRKSKTTRRRKPGAKAPGRKRKTRVSGVAATPATKVIGGQRFTKMACGLTKTEAGKKAENHRAKGKAQKARVVKNTAGKGYCVFARG